MKNFGEQPAQRGEVTKGTKPLRGKHSPDKSPDLVDIGLNIGLKMLAKPHSFHGMGLEIPGSAALESATYHSLDAGAEKAVSAGALHSDAIFALEREKADLQRVNQLVVMFERGEIHGKKNRSVEAEENGRRPITIH